MRRHERATSAGPKRHQIKSWRHFAALSTLALVLVAPGVFAPLAPAAVTDKGINGAFGPIALTAAERIGGRLSSPGGLAVNQANGSIYVAESDANNSRISVFDSSGVFLRNFGKDVVELGPGNTGTGFEICVPANGDACKRGVNFAPQVGGVMGVPRGVALDASGNLYVSDQNNLRVQKFDSNGNFLLAFGQDVAESGPGNTGTDFEVCVAANGDVCKAGISASTGGAFKSTFNGYLTIAPPGAPNAGNLLVADPANLRVQEFTASGAFTRTFGFDVIAGNLGTGFEVCEVAAECQTGTSGSEPGQFSNSVNRIAEDAAGNIYTVESGSPNFWVQKFTLPGNVPTPQGSFAETSLKGTSSANNPTDVAIDPATGNVLVTKVFPAGSTATCPKTSLPSIQERRVVEVSTAGALEATHMACTGINVANGLAVRGLTGDVFVSSTTGGLGIYGLNTPLLLPDASLSGVSDISAHSAVVSGFVNPNGPTAVPYGPTTSYHFEYKRSSDPSFTSKIPATGNNLGKGTTSQFVSVKLPALEAATSYDVKLVATKPFTGTVVTGTFSFTTISVPAEIAVPNATTAIYEKSATETRARAALWGSVTPNSKPTTYRFEYGTTASYGTKVPAPEEAVGSGNAKVPVAQFIDDLEPNATYHFRIVAKNINGTVAGSDQTFTTPPLPSATGSCTNEALRVEQNSTFLPECRAYELVSPTDKGSSGAVNPGLDEQAFNQASEDGGSFLYPIQNGIPASTAGGWTRWHAGRSAAGWSSAQISAPSLIPPPQINGIGIANPSLVQYGSSDLGCAVLETYNPLTLDTPPLDTALGVTNLYRWSANGGYTLISNNSPLNPTIPIPSEGGRFYSRIEASEDCSRVYFRSQYELISGGSGLYEWDEGTLRDAGQLPNGTVGTNMVVESSSVGSAVVGGEVSDSGTARWNAVSPDGSLFFFSAISNEGSDKGKLAIFMREDGGEGVVDISQSQTAVPTTGARYEAASTDGSRVFFRANYGIAAASSNGPTNQACGSLGATPETVFNTNPPIEQKPCDLYAYDVESGDLIDLSADPNPADPIGAAIQGVVAIDEDGSHVYFAALGQLVPGQGKTYAENIAGEGSANIYLNHDGQLSYVTTLNRGNEVNGDLFGGNSGGNSVLMRTPTRWSAEATVDGSRLLFESVAKLTGYNTGGGKAAYLYSADTEEITCVSCRLDGLPTLVKGNGEVDQVPSTNSPSLLASPRARFLDFRPNSMSEDGSRIFFTSPDVLAPGGVAGERNVYEWANGQVYFLAITAPSGSGFIGDLGIYLDASASGDDVFIGTKEQLASQDIDFIADVYDVRVNGGFANPPPPPPCQVDESAALLPDQDYCQGDSPPQLPAPAPGSPGVSGPGNPKGSEPGPKPCPKGKVRRHGKCVKRPKRSSQRGKRNRAANTNRGGAK